MNDDDYSEREMRLMRQRDEALTRAERAEEKVNRGVTVTVHNCARCKGNHTDLWFVPFKYYIEGSGETHWAMCPTVYAPILLTVS